jgi:hypothetical protein
LDKINWITISTNPNAMHIIEQNFNEEVDCLFLLQNPSIFEIDYNYIKERMDIIREELMMKVLDPKRLQYYLNLGYSIEDITS